MSAPAGEAGRIPPLIHQHYIKTIKGLYENILKIVTFVPESHADIIRKAMGDAGAGIIGNYSNCTYSTKGIGRFKPLNGANPTVGTIGEVETVAEERIETICEHEKIEQVVKAINDNHPYEIAPIDIYEIQLY